MTMQRENPVSACTAAAWREAEWRGESTKRLRGTQGNVAPQSTQAGRQAGRQGADERLLSAG